MAIKMSQLLALILTLTLTIISPAMAQNCGCAAGFCCSKYRYCGKSNDYCGDGCRSGPCNKPASNEVVVSNVVTQGFFDRIAQHVQGNCPARGFYTRQAFLNALGSYQSFGTTGNAGDSKREIAAFFAHATHETGYFCYRDERTEPKPTYCNTSSPEARKYPCNPSKKYFGRGPLQLTWNYNYGPAGQALRFDGLNAPETLSSDPTLSFKSALWFWYNANVHSLITSGQGFGATIRAINGDQECNGKNTDKMNDRIAMYRDYCNKFGVDPGNNISC